MNLWAKIAQIWCTGAENMQNFPKMYAFSIFRPEFGLYSLWNDLSVKWDAYERLTGREKGVFGAAHTRMANIREYPPWGSWLASNQLHYEYSVDQNKIY